MWKAAFTSLAVLLAGCDRSPSPSAFHAHGPDDVAAPDGAPAPPPREQAPSAAVGAGAEKTVYVCPMHSEVVSDKPGTCPKCNMTLEPRPAKDAPDGGTHEHAGHVHAAAETGTHAD